MYNKSVFFSTLGVNWGVQATQNTKIYRSFIVLVKLLAATLVLAVTDNREEQNFNVI